MVICFVGFDKDHEANAERTLKTFREFIEENRDELTALRIIYNQRYKDRPMVIEQLKALYEKLTAKTSRWNGSGTAIPSNNRARSNRERWHS